MTDRAGRTTRWGRFQDSEDELHFYQLLPMTTVVIAFRPETARGRRILNDLELRFDLWPMQVVGDGTRRYRIDQDGAEVDGFDSSLDQVDGGWRDHLTAWRET